MLCVLLAGTQGCGAGGILTGIGQRLGGGLGGIVSLVGGALTAGGLGARLAGPAGPESSAGIPAPGAGTAPPAGARQRQQVPPVGLADGVAELRDKHGITVRGSYTATDIQNALLSSRQYNPGETNGLDISYAADRVDSGVLGVWSDGQMEIYGDQFDVVFHEMSHHITLYDPNTRTTALGDQVLAAARQAGGGEIPSSCITRDYAMSNDAEFLAEFQTGLAGIERGMPLEFTIENDAFNPPESVRQVARSIYAAQ